MDGGCSELLKLDVVVQALHRLRTGLPPGLFYHTPEHTADVIAEVARFSSADSLGARERELLVVGAAYHDLGFIERIRGNESIGAQLAGAAMRAVGRYSPEEIAAVETMIRDTEVKFLDRGPRQVPTTELSKYLCDADVSNLGRADFLEKAELVRREVNVPRDESFFTNLRKFVAGHEWYTPAAKAARTKGKADNIAALDRILKERAW